VPLQTIRPLSITGQPNNFVTAAYLQNQSYNVDYLLLRWNTLHRMESVL